MVDHKPTPFVPSFLRSGAYIAYGEMTPDDWNSIRHSTL